MRSIDFPETTSDLRVTSAQRSRSRLALSFAAGLSMLALCPPLHAQARRPVNLDDLARLRDVRDPQCSPDGKWVAYTVNTVDVKGDKHNTHVWMVAADGSGKDIQLTESQESESSPEWSPDGKYLAFSSSRHGKAKGSQVWILNRGGGEATQLTDVKGKLQDYEWSPDSKSLALVVADPDPDEPQGDSATSGKPKPPKPIVIDRYHFRQDVVGYLLSNRHTHIVLFDIATKRSERLTRGDHDESAPVWSPDGTRIAFISNHDAEPDRDPVPQVFVADARPGVVERQVTDFKTRGTRGRLAWSPDNKWIAFVVGDEKKWDAYGMGHIAIVPSDGSAAPVILTDGLDRSVSSPYFSADGKSIVALEEDDRLAYPISISIADRTARKLLQKPIVLSSMSHAGSCTVGIAGGDDEAQEVYSWADDATRQLTHQNDSLFAQLDLAKTVDVGYRTPDGTEVHGLLTYPYHYTTGTKVPLLLRIHGGPNGQDAHSFNFERQIFAANGYAVLNVNYRGSSGRGQKYQRAIFADWGDHEVQDLKAGIAHVISMGVADPSRIGVGGWSYGCILTDYMIASDPTLKAATCGAGTGFTVALYGVDQYIIQYDNEIGPPWNPKSWETYQKLSYPFLHADRIKTPTLYFSGEKDANVPIIGNEEMYQALRSLGVPTGLIIYPNEFHGIQRPSFQRDRYERYLAWYAKYMKP